MRLVAGCQRVADRHIDRPFGLSCHPGAYGDGLAHPLGRPVRQDPIEHGSMLNDPEQRGHLCKTGSRNG